MRKIREMLRSIISKIASKKYYFLLILVINYFCYRYAFDYYFVHDDWALLWSSKYNPNDFYYSTVGSFWLIRTGLFHLLYFQLHSILDNSLQWQLIGFTLKVVNSIIFYYFIKQITKDNNLAKVGGIVFAAYAGGIEAYTWHLPTALVITFLLLALIYYTKFIQKFNILDLFGFVGFITLSLLSYLGRMIGIFPLLFLWNGLLIFKEKDKRKIKKLLVINLLILISLFVVSKFMPSFTGSPLPYLLESFKHPGIFFESIGNLLKVPFFTTQEIGGLAEPNKLSFIFGLVGVGAAGIIFISYLTTKKDKYILLLVSIAWIYGFYLFNWLYGGGGVSTLVGSTHRYLSVSGVGAVFLMVLLTRYISKSSRTVAIILLTFMCIAQANKINESEGLVRYRHIVKPIYDQLFEKMKNDDHVQLVVVDSPNILKSFVVTGWYPYTYAYYKGLKDISEFPVVIDYWENAVQWACADKNEKLVIQTKGGFVDNRKEKDVEVNHIYAWSLTRDGQLIDKTDKFRQIVNECNNGIQ